MHIFLTHTGLEGGRGDAPDTSGKFQFLKLRSKITENMPSPPPHKKKNKAKNKTKQKKTINKKNISIYLTS